MKIKNEIVQTIHNRMDIMDVVGDFVSLKKKGQNYWACCPFHNEKTASFSLNPAKGIFKCFGCGKGGDAISFIMELENFTYPEALQYLAKKYNIEIEEDTRPTDQQLLEQNERESLLALHEFAKNYFTGLLQNDIEGQTVGLAYFKERGFKNQVIQDFELGYSLTEWSNFTTKALEYGFSQELLEKSGLSIKTEKGSLIDRFRERVIFPIHNTAGKVIAFGGRILKSDKKTAKYLNSPETPIYHKSNVLYGLFQAKKKIKELDNCYLVEGYTDVISLHQADIQNVIASSGTSLTVEQIRLIRRFTENVTILYDGDLAGIKASLRGIDLLLEEGLNVKVISFPDSEDPDSYLKKVGQTAFHLYLEEKALDFITFKTQLFLPDIQNEPIKKAELIRSIVESIAKIPDEIKQRIYYQECGRLLQIDESLLISEGAKLSRTQKPKPANSLIPSNQVSNVQETEKPKIDESDYPQEREAIRLLLNYGSIELPNGKKVADWFIEETDDLTFQHPVYLEILNEFKTLGKSNIIPSASYFLQNENYPHQDLIIDLMSERYSLSNNWEKKFKVLTILEPQQLRIVVFENILRLKLAQIDRLLNQNYSKLQVEQDQEKQDELLNFAIRIKGIKTEITKKMAGILPR